MSIAADSEAVVELSTAIGKDMGQLTKLATADKASLVDAINEIEARIRALEANT